MAARVRDTARTRRQVLDAAAQVVTAQGAGASLDAVARAAGVSKSGLLHHFSSRDQLLLELAQDLLEQFDTALHAAVDPADHAPGRWVRAYVTATFDALDAGPAVADHVVLMAALGAVPGVPELLGRDTERWRRLFEIDGLDAQRALVITKAADGAAVAGLYEGPSDPDRRAALRDLLMALSQDQGPLATSGDRGGAARTPVTNGS